MTSLIKLNELKILSDSYPNHFVFLVHASLIVNETHCSIERDQHKHTKIHIQGFTKIKGCASRF